MQRQQQARVLIVDNDIRVVHQLQPLLERRGFHVSSTGYNEPVDESSETVWNDSIINFARNYRPHIAIVDLRLRNDYMDEESGLLIIPQLDAAHNILYSARLTFDVVERAQDKGVFRCIPKGSGGTTKLLDAIGEAATQASVFYAGVDIQWPAQWSGQSVIHSIFRDDSGIPTEMSDDLVLQLYKEEADNAEISDVTDQMLSQSPASLNRSAVVKVRPSGKEPSILKLAPSRRIRMEKRNYDTYVAKQMRGSFHTQLIDSTIFWDMGGLIYSLISGQNISSFAEHYIQNKSADRIVKPLEHLFEEVWRKHYEDGLSNRSNLKTGKLLDLYELYDEMYKYDELFEQRSKLNPTALAMPNTVEHPVDWLMRNKDRARISQVAVAITHGDLHSENIFVDEERAWLIDFERTGPGHILRDFVELEIDILTRLADSQIDAASFTKIGRMLLSKQAFGQQAYLLSLPHDVPAAIRPELTKAFETVLSLRAIARKLKVLLNMSEYRWALLLNSLFVAHHPSYSYPYPKKSRTTSQKAEMGQNFSEELNDLSNSSPRIVEDQRAQQRRALIYATLICEYFEEN